MTVLSAFVVLYLCWVFLLSRGVGCSTSVVIKYSKYNTASLVIKCNKYNTASAELNVKAEIKGLYVLKAAFPYWRSQQKAREDTGVTSLMSLRSFCCCPRYLQALLSAGSLCKKKTFCPLKWQDPVGFPEGICFFTPVKKTPFVT